MKRICTLAMSSYCILLYYLCYGIPFNPIPFYFIPTGDQTKPHLMLSHPSNFIPSYVMPSHPVLFHPHFMCNICLILLYTTYSCYRMQRKVRATQVCAHDPVRQTGSQSTSGPVARYHMPRSMMKQNVWI